MIIVLHDTDISATARYKGHCRDKYLLAKEEETAKAIIIDAINKYILDKDEKKVTSETYDYWHAEQFQSGRRRLSGEGLGLGLGSGSGTGTGLDASMIIPSKNKVVLVSYETMMHLGEVYVEMLYKTLGIESNYMPSFKNGNSKYVPNSPYRSGTSSLTTSRTSSSRTSTTGGKYASSQRAREDLFKRPDSHRNFTSNQVQSKLLKVLNLR